MVKTFDEYMEFTNTTMQFDSEVALDYLILGAAGEVGEFINKLKKVLRGDYKLDKANKRFLALELGDVCWYVNALMYKFRIKPSNYVENDIEKYFEFFKGIQGTDTLYKNACELSYLISVFGKAHFDGLRLDNSKIRNFYSSVTDLIAIIAGQLDYSLLNVINKNVDKLSERKIEGTIKGSGDIDRVAKIFGESERIKAKSDFLEVEKAEKPKEPEEETIVNADGTIGKETKPVKNARHQKTKKKTR